MTMELECSNTSCCKVFKEVSKSCQKEKSLVNLNFNTAPFLVFDTNYKFQNTFFDMLVKENIRYNNTLIPNYSCVIWQPPEQFQNI